MSPGRFLEDFFIGQRFHHALPRTIHGGDISLYIALTGDRSALSSSTEFARSLGFVREVVPDLLVFHMVFGQTVTDVSYRAIANLGYAEVKFLRPVYPGDTLSAHTEVIGQKPTSKGDAGVVYVRTVGSNQKGQPVLSFVRWVLVPISNTAAAAGIAANVPAFESALSIHDLSVPEMLNLQRFADLMWVTGSSKRWQDYEPLQQIAHAGAMTIEESCHMQATRLYHNNAQVHFDGHGMSSSRFGKRLVYGGHVMSVAHALAQPDLGNALIMAGWNSGLHSSPTFAGDTIRAGSVVLQCEVLPLRSDVGAVRCKLVAATNVNAQEIAQLTATVASNTAARDPRIVLELDYWTLVPR
jgi:2-methylfumaryl-CoA hydratase